MEKYHEVYPSYLLDTRLRGKTEEIEAELAYAQGKIVSRCIHHVGFTVILLALIILMPIVAVFSYHNIYYDRIHRREMERVEALCNITSYSLSHMVMYDGDNGYHHDDDRPDGNLEIVLGLGVLLAHD